MAPVPITEDYYLVLEVGQTADPDLIIRSYKRLALKLHPDRNSKHDATQAFQLLGQAYATLKDASKRQSYDLIYPSITRSRPPPQTTQTPRPPPASTPQSVTEAAQIAAIQKSKQERSARWWTKKTVFDSSIFELQREVRRLEQEIKNLNSIVATEVAEEARKHSWGTWLLSPLYKKVEDSEEEKARKDRERQERRFEKDMKERRLVVKKVDLNKEECISRKAKEEKDDADLIDETRIRKFQDIIRVREAREMQERERVERERVAKMWKQQQEKWEKLAREAAEVLRKQQAEERAVAQKRQAEELAAAQKRQAEYNRMYQKSIEDEAKKRRERYAHHNPHEHFFAAEASTRQASTSTCVHSGWWSKVQGRTACPECSEVWTYLLQCPTCSKKACPKCQAAIRRRIPRDKRRTNQRAFPRTPSPDYFYDDY